MRESLTNRGNGLVLSPELREKVVHQFHILWKDRDEHFGNARVVRNSFEAVIHAQANRLAPQANVDPAAPSRLEAEDLNMPLEAALTQFRSAGGRYVIHCDHFREHYTWKRENNLRECICEKCGKTLDGEFGTLAEPDSSPRRIDSSTAPANTNAQ